MKFHLVQTQDGNFELKPIAVTGVEQDGGTDTQIDLKQIHATGVEQGGTADVPIVTKENEDPNMPGPTEKKAHSKHKKETGKKRKKKKTKKKSGKIEHHSASLKDGITEKRLGEVDDGVNVETIDATADQDVEVESDIKDHSDPLEDISLRRHPQQILMRKKKFRSPDIEEAQQARRRSA
jgi:hypothetical protein